MSDKRKNEANESSAKVMLFLLLPRGEKDIRIHIYIQITLPLLSLLSFSFSSTVLSP